jgi:hypothetical protein
MTAAIGIEYGHLQRGDRLALLGIGSGINVVMLGIDWQRSLTQPAASPCSLRHAAAEISR